MQSIFEKHDSPSIWWPQDTTGEHLLNASSDSYAITGADAVLVKA
jgi:hypothetical protein